MKCSTKKKGFTLIEVMVALFILSLVLGSAVQMVHQYSDERLRIREHFLLIRWLGIIFLSVTSILRSGQPVKAFQT